MPTPAANSSAAAAATVLSLILTALVGPRGVRADLSTSGQESSSRLFSSLLGARNDAGSSSSGGGVRQARRRDPKRIGVLVEIETESIVRAKGFPAHTGSFFSMTEGRGPEWIDREHSGTTGGTEALSGERRRQVVPPLPGVAHQRGVIARLRGGGKGMEHARTAARRGNDKKGSSPNGGVVLGGRDKRDLVVRTKSGIVMVTSFVAIIVGLKQTGCAILVAFLQWALFREGMALVRDEVSEVLLEAERGAGRSLRRRQWGVFWVLGLAVYGSLLTKEIAGLEPVYSGVGLVLPRSLAQLSRLPALAELMHLPAWMLSFLRWHSPVCAAMYTGLLLEFVTSLRSPPMILYQLGQLAAAHFACFLILPSVLVSFAARAGLIWFVIPSASVIVNDIAAYICGRLFGRTPLTPLSPNKTWEGFVGAALCTSVAGLVLGRCLGSVDWLTTPRNVFLSTWGLRDARAREVLLETVELPWAQYITLSRGELHGFWIAMLASLVGPFGGFLASGIKRAYGVKDFGDSIPGHGGAGDRFDCQVMLLPLVYFYLKAFDPELDI